MRNMSHVRELPQHLHLLQCAIFRIPQRPSILHIFLHADREQAATTIGLIRLNVGQGRPDVHA